MRSIDKFSFILVCALLLAACNEQKKAPETGAKPTTVNAVQPSGDVSGQTVTVGGGQSSDDHIEYGGDEVNLPVGWPAFLKVYEGGKIVSSQRMERVQGIFMSLGVETQDPAEVVLAHYRELFEQKGFEMSIEASVENHLSQSFSKDKQTIEVQCNTEPHRTMVYLTIRPDPNA